MISTYVLGLVCLLSMSPILLVEMRFSFPINKMKNMFKVILHNDSYNSFTMPNITIPISIPNIYFTGHDMHQVLMIFQ